MNKKISAIGIKKIYYGQVINTIKVPYDETNKDNATGLSPKELKDFLAEATTKEVPNVHQDTWNYEETEASITPYKNQLTKKVYRKSTDPGETSIKFSIGQYDFGVIADFKGGVATADKYSAPSTHKDIEMTIVALTEDDVYIVFPKASIDTNAITTDDAIALAVTATPLEPNFPIETVVWISKTSVNNASED